MTESYNQPYQPKIEPEARQLIKAQQEKLKKKLLKLVKEIL